MPLSTNGVTVREVAVRHKDGYPSRRQADVLAQPVLEEFERIERAAAQPVWRLRFRDRVWRVVDSP